MVTKQGIYILKVLVSFQRTTKGANTTIATKTLPPATTQIILNLSKITSRINKLIYQES